MPAGGRTGWFKWSGIATGVAVGAALIAAFLAVWLIREPGSVTAGPKASLTLQTVATLGYGKRPDWVSYLTRDAQGEWSRSTTLRVPAHSLVTVTIRQYDTSTGLRNPLWGRVRGTVGGTMRLNGRTVREIDPDLPGHTFAIPQLGVSVPLQGVSDDAPNQCSTAPCSSQQAHNTVTFTFRTGERGRYAWQCFVPCAAGFLYGNGGPMQTLGYMDGYVQVV